MTRGGSGGCRRVAICDCRSEVPGLSCAGDVVGADGGDCDWSGVCGTLGGRENENQERQQGVGDCD